MSWWEVTMMWRVVPSCLLLFSLNLAFPGISVCDQKMSVSPFIKAHPWDCPVPGGRSLGTADTPGPYTHIRCCPWPPPQLLASASYDDTVKLYREEEDDWVCCATLEGHESTVWSLAFDPSGQRLASCSDDRTVRIWRQYLPGNEQGEGPA